MELMRPQHKFIFKKLAQALKVILVFVLIFAWIFFGIFQIKNLPPKPHTAQATVTTVFASSNSADGALTGWTNPTYAYNDDGTQLATRAGTAKNTWYGTLYGFNLSGIPDNVVINSINITAEWKNSTNDSSGPVLYLGAQSGGAEVGTGTSDTSGQNTFELVTNSPAGLTVADLKATGANGFWAILRFRRTDNTTHTASVDYVKVTVDYTPLSAPTDVAASDGTYTDKVTVTWTKSTGATGYRVYRDNVDVSGLLGDVATYDDSGADAPTITPGTASATDGTSSTQVDLSLSGASANNGTTHTYKVVAFNGAIASPDSTTNTGYRGVGSLTYQWQRSAADSDTDYSEISGATSATYGDTGAPADGSGRYYKCVLNANGASQQVSAADRGYRAAPVISITVSDSNVTYGTLAASSTRSTLASEENEMQTVTNDSTIAVNINIKGSVSSPAGWTLGSNPGNNIYVHKFCNDTNNDCSSPPANYTPLTTGYAALAANVPVSGTVDFQLQITTPTTVSDYTEQDVDVWVQAVAP